MKRASEILSNNSRLIMLKYIYRRRGYLKKKVHELGDALFNENSQNFSEMIYQDWMNTELGSKKSPVG